jgi:hypothetical protein
LAPLVRTTEDSILLPIYGLDINPILFLLTDLRSRYPSDWAVMANRREGRWIQELAEQFNSPGWTFNDKNLKLKHDGKDVTDIDFAVFDRRDGALAVMQLKWQQPIGIDERQRRNAGSNLTGECNAWIERVMGWLAIYGVEELVRRLGFPSAPRRGSVWSSWVAITPTSPARAFAMVERTGSIGSMCAEHVSKGLVARSLNCSMRSPARPRRPLRPPRRRPTCCRSEMLE